MDEWGFDGPSVSDVDSFQQMYGETYTVGFTTVETKNEAQHSTGWPTWDDKVLEVPNLNGLIKTNEPGKPPRYYADFFLRETDHIHELLTDAGEAVQALQTLHNIVQRSQRRR